MKAKTWIQSGLIAGIMAVLVAPAPRGEADVDPSCRVSGTPTEHSGSALATFAVEKNGVAWESAYSQLRLSRAGGLFSMNRLGIVDPVVYACPGDFDEDGWVDFVGAGDSPTTFIKFYKNNTGLNPEPDWSNPSAIRTPRFDVARVIEPNSSSGPSRGAIACADFNDDKNMDFLYARCVIDLYASSSNANSTTCYATRADMFLGNGDGSFQLPRKFVATGSTLQRLTWGETPVVADYNGDNKPDLIWGAGSSVSSTSLMANKGGDVLLLLNDGAAQPTFRFDRYLLQNAGFGLRGPLAMVYEDFTGDAVKDLVVGSPSSSTMRLYPGLLGGGLSTTTVQYLSSGGAATVALAADFTLERRIDLLMGTDNWNYYTSGRQYHMGGNAYYYKNDGDGQPFSAGVTRQLSSHQDSPPLARPPSPYTCDSMGHCQTYLWDFDLGFVINYDNDPEGTPDFIVADGNHSSNYYVFANRTMSQFVQCGSVASGILDIGALRSEDMTITSIRLDPTFALTGGTVSWELSNDNGATWHAATPCADDTTKYCTTFGSAFGNEIRWRARMCANSMLTRSPSITKVGVSYTYVVAENHLRAGPVARDGLVYVGAFRQPGDSGRMYWIDDEAGGKLQQAGVDVEAADRLDDLSPSSRKMYTVSSTGARVDFSRANISDRALQQAVLAPDAATADAIIQWQQSKRFGVLASQKQVLGAVENSTAAILTPPKAPYWYDNSATTSTERTAIDAYVNQYVNRPQLVLVGTKDAALHAFHTNPSNFADSKMATEAWAFIPYDIAQRLNTDRTSGDIQAYPDGAPTLANAKVAGRWRTVLVSGEGKGGRCVFALDVTDTVNQSTGAIIGPTPLWQYCDTNMGRTYSKPAVIRVKVGTTEKWMVVFASGPGLSTDVGDTVYALDIDTGGLIWRFDLNDTNCYVATDITAVETDDEAGMKIDGFVDLLLFADNKGRVWKLAPGVYFGTTIYSIGSVYVGLSKRALFSTRVTPGALGVDRAIGGTLAVGEDRSKKLVIFFGTGGTEESPNGVQNAFYSVDVATGGILDKLDSEDGITPGMKFYGGVVYNSDDRQLILTVGEDSAGSGLCDPTSGKVMAINADTFREQFTIELTSKMMGPLFVRDGQFYTVTMGGDLVTSAYGGSGGGGSGGGSGGAGGTGGTGGTGGSGGSGGSVGTAQVPFSIIGWKQEF
ncbi:MAG: VCBS repeat-containing protein [Deltaproteobacteria bacterium]|nr:VCBS repeat-containing protein [Deltaproteobacteria bacterium]